MQEIFGDKQPVGLYDSQESFTAKELELKEGEEIFLFTDGFATNLAERKVKRWAASDSKSFCGR
ncbi:MAG: hypothetical protein KatS3mg028_0269 [Bacteroidia bacterium]|nr:MAG: hypothetical protein KatS3mg028_0269 [Bacteroidia bacterium]